MKRYAVIATEKVNREDPPIHWLLRGTLVEILEDGKVECVSPCYGVDVAQFSKRKHVQFVNPEDVIELSDDAVEGVSREWFKENLYK